MQQKLFKYLKKLLRTNKVAWYGQLTTKVKYFRNLDLKNDLLNDMVTKFKVSKTTIVFKIALSRLIDEYPKIKNSSLSLNYFKKHLKLIK